MQMVIDWQLSADEMNESSGNMEWLVGGGWLLTLEWSLLIVLLIVRSHRRLRLRRWRWTLCST